MYECLVKSVITHFLVIPQFIFFSLLKKYKKIKNIIKKYNSEKRMPERSENGQKWLRRFKNAKIEI
jgi:large-conductance mechanosensitive channel